jgi:hypothetical protein
MCSLNIWIQVLKKEFPRGVDIIYESVGGEMFDLCLNALAVHGHLIVIGMISQVILVAPELHVFYCILWFESGNIWVSDGEHVKLFCFSPFRAFRKIEADDLGLMTPAFFFIWWKNKLLESFKICLVLMKNLLVMHLVNICRLGVYLIIVVVLTPFWIGFGHYPVFIVIVFIKIL